MLLPSSAAKNSRGVNNRLIWKETEGRDIAFDIKPSIYALGQQEEMGVAHASHQEI